MRAPPRKTRKTAVTVYLTPEELSALDAYRPKGTPRATVLWWALRAFDRMKDAHLSAAPVSRP